MGVLASSMSIPARAIGEEGASTENLPPEDQAIGKPVGAFS